MLLLAVPAIAQSSDTSESGQHADASPVTTEPLRERLNELQQQLESERQALETMRRRHETELSERRQRRRALAGELLQAEAQRQRLKEQTTSLQPQRRAIEQTVNRLREAWQRLSAAGRTAAQQLVIHLRQLPGRSAWRARAKQLRQQLAQGATDKTPEPTLSVAPEQIAATRPAAIAAAVDASPLIALTSLLNQVHRDGTRVTLRPSRAWTADGSKRSVQLLSVGHVSFAYHRPDAAQPWAITVAAPAEASGFRWRTDLASQTQQHLREAFDRLSQKTDSSRARGAARAGGSPSPLAVPMDVTGDIRAEARLGPRGRLATVREGGLVMAPLGAVALLALILIGERVWRLHVRNRGGGRLAQRVIAAAGQGRYDQALTHCRQRANSQSRVLAACLHRRARGQHAMEDAIQEQLMHESPRLQRRLGGLAVLAAVAPLLGLLGTVTGIIETFSVIRSAGSTDPSLMAGGISEALLTTAAGLSLAIPILLIHSALKGRADRILADSEKHAAELLNTLVYHQTPPRHRLGIVAFHTEPRA